MNIQDLPSEIIFHILHLLPPTSLAIASAVSKSFRCHAHDDLLWELHIREHVEASQTLSLPPTVHSWRDLYKRHHPYWFIVRHKIWHSDSGLRGDILVTNYDIPSGSILAYTVFGRDRVPLLTSWQNAAAFGPSTFMSPFQPEIQVWTQEPIVKLDLDQAPAGHKLQDEVELPMIRDAHARLSMCTTIPLDRQHSSMSLWPPWTLPAIDRVRNESPSRFASNKQRPHSLSAASDKAFRIRTWTELTRALPLLNPRIGEQTTTWSALLRETYSPSKQKPWQGIWIGDYSTHGCEFLLVMQKRVSPNRQRIDVPESASGLPYGYLFAENETPARENSLAVCDLGAESEGEILMPFNRLEAIKLTGDPNIPRGQCTWLAEDIGNELIRVPEADEMFGGSKIVRSHVHIADQGFRNDRYTESQLILKDDYDHIFQHWGVCFHLCHSDVQADPSRPSITSQATKEWMLMR